MDYSGLSEKSKFKVPRINGQYIIISLWAAAMIFCFFMNWLWEPITEKPLLIVFWIAWLVLGVMALRYKFSLLPVMGILFNLYLMTELGVSNWTIFVIWLAIGLVIYFSYGYKKSKLAP